MSRPVELSVIIPCYRAAALARQSVNALRIALPQFSSSWELIIVDDGGGDFQDNEWDQDPFVRLLRLPVNRGKGAAIRAGLLEACGTARIFTDVDLPFGVKLFPIILDILLHHRVHLVIGDRTRRQSSYSLRVSASRKLASAVFSKFVGTMVTGGHFDTQCGLKALRGDVADVLCPHLRIDRFACDVELLYVALKHHLDIKGIPVKLEQNTTTSVRLVRDSLQSMLDVLRIKLWQLKGGYSIPALDEIVERDFADLVTNAQISVE
jgi:dolichyl-phosphate beta-glucosyltransferase